MANELPYDCGDCPDEPGGKDCICNHGAMNDAAMKALEEVASCSTWHIRYSSEMCEISISGVPVYIEAGVPKKVYFSSGPGIGYDLSFAITEAAKAFNAECYPHRLEAKETTDG